MTGNLNFVIIFVLDILVGTRDVSSSSVINFMSKEHDFKGMFIIRPTFRNSLGTACSLMGVSSAAT